MKKSLLFLGMAAVVACARTSDPAAGNNPTQTLLAKLEEAHQALAQSPVEELLQLQSEVDDYYQWFYHEYKDTSKPDFWIYNLSDLQRVHKGIQRAGSEPQELMEAIAFSQQQLNDLRTAFEQGELDSTSFNTFLMDEEQATEAVAQRALYRSNETRLCIEIWEKVKPSLDSTRSFHTQLAPAE